MADVMLIPMTSQDLGTFIDEEIADYADERVLDGSWARRDALGRARLTLHNVIGWERQAVTDTYQRLWTALDVGGEHVGWVWVKLAPPGPNAGCAFLCQLTVARAFRHQGYGRAMLAALEACLVTEGVADLELNVYEANIPAKALYTSAGFDCTARFPTMCRLRKPLNPSRTGRAAVEENSPDFVRARQDHGDIGNHPT